MLQKLTSYVRIASTIPIAYFSTNALFESVVMGHFPAIKFYLCNRDPENWKDKREFDSRSEEAVTVIHYECERDL